MVAKSDRVDQKSYHIRNSYVKTFDFSTSRDVFLKKEFNMKDYLLEILSSV